MGPCYSARTFSSSTPRRSNMPWLEGNWSPCLGLNMCLCSYRVRLLPRLVCLVSFVSLSPTWVHIISSQLTDRQKENKKILFWCHLLFTFEHDTMWTERSKNPGSHEKWCDVNWTQDAASSSVSQLLLQKPLGTGWRRGEGGVTPRSASADKTAHYNRAP